MYLLTTLSYDERGPGVVLFLRILSYLDHGRAVELFLRNGIL